MGRYVMKSETDFESVRLEAEGFYDQIGSIRCPYFDGDVVFSAKGIRHLKFKSDGKSRSHPDVYTRFKLLYRVPELLKLSRTVQGIYRTRRFERQKTNNRWENVLKNVTFYEFVAVLDDVRIKVIVKEVEDGSRHFLSVIPFWKLRRNTGERLLHDQSSKDELL